MQGKKAKKLLTSEEVALIGAVCERYTVKKALEHYIAARRVKPVPEAASFEMLTAILADYRNCLVEDSNEYSKFVDILNDEAIFVAQSFHDDTVVMAARCAVQRMLKGLDMPQQVLPCTRIHAQMPREFTIVPVEVGARKGGGGGDADDVADVDFSETSDYERSMDDMSIPSTPGTLSDIDENQYNPTTENRPHVGNVRHIVNWDEFSQAQSLSSSPSSYSTVKSPVHPPVEMEVDDLSSISSLSSEDYMPTNNN